MAFCSIRPSEICEIPQAKRINSNAILNLAARFMNASPLKLSGFTTAEQIHPRNQEAHMATICIYTVPGFSGDAFRTFFSSRLRKSLRIPPLALLGSCRASLVHHLSHLTRSFACLIFISVFPLALTSGQEPPLKAIQALNLKANSLEYEGRWTEAIDSLNKAEQLALQFTNGRGPDFKRTLDLLGCAYLNLDRFARARDYLRRALPLCADDPRHVHFQLANTYSLVAVAFVKEVRYDSALAYLSMAFDEHKAGGTDQHEAAASILSQLGQAESFLGNYDRAESYLDSSLALTRRLGRDQTLTGAVIYHELARARAGKGDGKGAAELEEKALRITKAQYGDRHMAVSSSYIALAEFANMQGEFDRAGEYYRAAVDLLRELGPEYERKLADAEIKQARALREAGNYDIAAQQCSAAIVSLRKELGNDHPDVAAAQGDLALILLKAGRDTEARAEIDSVLSTPCTASDGNDLLRARLYAEQARILSGDKGVRVSARDSACALLARQESVNPVQAAAILRTLGDAYAADDRKASLELYEKSLRSLSPAWTGTSPSDNPDPARSVNGKELLLTLLSKATLLEKMGPDFHDAALRTYERAAQTVSDVRRSLRSDRAKLELGQQTTRICAGGLRLSLERYHQTGNPGDLARAFRFADEAKVGVFMGEIAAGEAAKQAGVPDSLIAREKKLVEGIAYLERRLVKPPAGETPGQTERIALNLFARHRELDSLRQSVQNSSWGRKSESAPATWTGLAGIQARLRDNECMLEYFCGDKSLTIFIVRKDLATVVEQPLPKNLEVLVRGYLHSLRTADAREYAQSSERLHRLLIRPAEKYVGTSDRLIIVPDGLLAAIPFEALAPHPAPEHNSPAAYLINSRAISYAYSAEHWKMLSGRGGDAFEERFVGFAPVFGDSSHNGLLAQAGDAHQRLDADQLRSVTVDGKRLAALPYSGLEIINIAGEFSKRGKSPSLFMNASATKGAFEKEADNARFVHLATHGIVSGTHPELSALLFAQPPAGMVSDEGILFANEIEGLRLNADLLVLSSCESGVGKLILGEGTMAMTRGFFRAGVRNIVVSLWKVLDQPTATLMLKLYQNINRGLSYAEALRAAKIDMIKSSPSLPPGVWASFVLIGR
jgi:CHAT domain-containing protein/tetratricopeptide (TPR) repeat protein